MCIPRKPVLPVNKKFLECDFFILSNFLDLSSTYITPSGISSTFLNSSALLSDSINFSKSLIVG